VSQIAEPATVWHPGQTLDFDLTGISLANSRTLAEFDSFTLTVREDPHWPRRPFQDPYEDMDPVGDSWSVALTSAAGEAESVTVVSFDLTATETNLSPGEKRYAYEVVGVIDGTPDTVVVIVPATWLSVRAAVVARG
jgi:hypothetical protein